MLGGKELYPGYLALMDKYLDTLDMIEEGSHIIIAVHNLDSMNSLISEYLSIKNISVEYIVTGHTHSGEINIRMPFTDRLLTAMYKLFLIGGYKDLNAHFANPETKLVRSINNTLSISHPGCETHLTILKRTHAYQPGIIVIHA
jgi:hypothetical protein